MFLVVFSFSVFSLFRWNLSLARSLSSISLGGIMLHLPGPVAESRVSSRMPCHSFFITVTDSVWYLLSVHRTTGIIALWEACWAHDMYRSIALSSLVMSLRCGLVNMSHFSGALYIIFRSMLWVCLCTRCVDITLC